MKTPNIKVVELASGSRFLVVDDKAGAPVYAYDNVPVYHPDGYIYFPKRGYGYNQEYEGKLFKLVEVEVQTEVVPECISAKEKYKDYESLKTERDRLQYGRYEQHPTIIKKEDAA